MNIIEMRTMVRRDLHDEEEGNLRWTDDELDRHIAHAVKDFSEAIPDQVKILTATVSGSRILDISDINDRVYLEAVEFPVDRFPPEYQPFSIWGNRLTFLGDKIPDGSNTGIYYGKIHNIDVSGTSIPARYHDLVAAGAAGYAAVQWALYAGNRVNLGGIQTADKILNWGKIKLEFFYLRLKVLGTNNKVRVRRLYKE